MADLAPYNRKRDFTVTREPKGRKAKAAPGDSYVIQKHAARRLHYDLRLEMDGVLKSWAVTRGPSLVPGEKRLAVHVEDHPLDYGGFEGTIPKGEYGGGSVIVWDRGRWRPVGDAKRGYAKGHLEFEIEGEKLHGRWHLVRMGKRRGEKRENWLLIKSEDDFARGADDPDILEEEPNSVVSGRSVEAVVEGSAPSWSSKEKPAAKTARARRKKADPAAALPEDVGLSLATLAARPPAGPKWIHEVKFDGYRILARLSQGTVTLVTRGGLDWTERFEGPVTEALAALPVDTAILDGEIVVESGHGGSDFSALQADLSAGRKDRFVFYAFDLLFLDGEDLRDKALLSRKEKLARLIGDGRPALRWSEHFEESGDLVLTHACRLSLEGVVSKDRTAPYKAGRNRLWIKSKCSDRQEFVIGGYVVSTVSSHAIGSLALGVYEDGSLRHVGRVGTGFSAATAEALFERLQAIRSEESPFSGKLSAAERRGLVPVRPELVAEVEFRGWTGDRHLRHAAFRGIRDDKPARDVVLEAPAGRKKTAAAPAEPKRSVTLTHPDRVYWPDAGVTKAGLADYYSEIWPRIAPFVAGRPLALLRCPEGITGQSFFQKHAWKGMNRHVLTVHDPADPAETPMIAIADLDGLIGLVQGAVLEIHPWGAPIRDWDRPDMIVMDLDPGDGVAFPAIIEAAQEVRARLKEAGLESFVKTSGGKGLHVVAPLKPKAQWPAVKRFTQELARAMASDTPDRYVATISKSRRTGKILVDYLRNQRGATAVAAYSTRARPGAPVSMPLAWDELTPAIGPAYFTVANAPARIAAQRSDPWADFRAAAAVLKA